MPRPMPLDDYEDEGEDEGVPAGRRVSAWAVLAWAALGAGAMLALAAVGARNAVAAAPVAGLACFCGIAARVFQAEAHRRR